MTSENDNFIDEQKQSLQALGDRLAYEVAIAKNFVQKSKNPEIEKRWMNAIDHFGNHCLFQIKILIDSLDSYNTLPKAQIGFYVGKCAIQPFLEIINTYEQILNRFIDENQKLNGLIQERIDKRLKQLEDAWDKSSNSESKKLKRSLKSSLKHKIREMAFIRDTLFKHGIIDQTDHDILKFAWNIRNSMHNNFQAITDIDFSYPDIKTGKQYTFSYKKGQELDHPEDNLIAYHVVFEQIIHIQLRTLQNLRD